MNSNIMRLLKTALIILAVLNLVFLFGFNGEVPGFFHRQSSEESSASGETEAAEAIEDEAEEDKDALPVPEAIEPEEEEEEKVQRCRIIASGNVNMRSGPGTGNEVVQVLSPDTILVVTGEEENGWVPVLTEDGTEGYVFGNLIIMLEDAAENPEDGE